MWIEHHKLADIGFDWNKDVRYWDKNFRFRFDQIWEPSEKDNPSVDLPDSTQIQEKPDFNQVIT